MSVVISRTYEVSCAHRIEGHPKCGRLHGHNYIITVTVGCGYYGGGMVLDYAQLDRIVKPIVDVMDHKYIVSVDNENAEDPYAAIAKHRDEVYLLDRMTSTAEDIGDELSELISHALSAHASANVHLVSVEVRETSKSSCLITQTSPT